jgi:hypothetical protein
MSDLMYTDVLGPDGRMRTVEEIHTESSGYSRVKLGLKPPYREDDVIYVSLDQLRLNFRPFPETQIGAAFWNRTANQDSGHSATAE